MRERLFGLILKHIEEYKCHGTFNDMHSTGNQARIMSPMHFELFILPRREVDRVLLL